jgi:hypothetical protein
MALHESLDRYYVIELQKARLIPEMDKKAGLACKIARVDLATTWFTQALSSDLLIYSGPIISVVETI